MSELMTIAWVITAVLFAVSLLVVVLLLNTKKQGIKAPNYRGLVLFGFAWFIVGIAFMATCVLMNVPFWIGLPVTVLGLVYQFVGLWRQWKSQGT